MGKLAASEADLVELPTEAMIEAGAEKLEAYFSFSLDDPETVATSVFLAMWEKLPRGLVPTE
jgi:hypothetical protein